MGLTRLTIQGLRNLDPTDLAPGAGINWFHGANGAGKTSILEAIYVLARGRSFRAARLGGVIQHECTALQVAARRSETGLRLGIERSRDDWRGRIDGRDCHRISEFAAALPLVLIEPDSHRLIDGGPDRRRSYLDWQLFHVEPDYLSVWQRYARLLRQRNAALKSRLDTNTLSALESPMVQAAESINAWREEQVRQISLVVDALLSELAFRLPERLALHYRPGHPGGQSLAESIAEQRDSDRERGFTQRGPHRAELVLTSNGHSAAVELSRGQQKLLAVTLLLAQLVILDRSGTDSNDRLGNRSPLLLLDDPVSELDADHLDALLNWLSQQCFQSWITATRPADSIDRMFHVEQGRITQS